MGLFPLQGRPLSVGITMTCGFSFMLFGWDQGVFGGILTNATFIRQFDNPDATIQGQIVSTYDIGCIIGALISVYFGDRLGRRRSVAMSCIFVIIGGAIQASSFSLPQMIVGRIVAGLGIGQSIVENSSHYSWSCEVTWRYPIAMQCFWAIVTLALLPFMVESPRWLCYVGRESEGRAVLARLAGKDLHHPSVTGEFMVISETIAAEKAAGQVGWTELFRGGEQQNFRRILLGAGTSISQQMGGINVVVYYFPVILIHSFGFSPRMSLILSAVDFISLMIWGSVMTLLIDRFGRKPLMLFGALGCGMCFTVVTAGLAIGTKPTYAMSVAFVFGYHLFYGISFLCIPFLYPSEINSSRMRSIGNSVAMITNWIFVYVVVIMTPSVIENIAWRFYIIFAVLNFVWFPIVWFFYIETNGLSLEEIDLMFKIKYHGGKEITYKKAAKLAKEQANIVREQGNRGKDAPSVQMNEYLDQDKEAAERN